MLAEEALMRANVRAALDPNPARAFRYKPFAYGPFGAAVPAPAFAERAAAAARTIAAATRRAVPAARPAAATRLAPCC